MLPSSTNHPALLFKCYLRSVLNDLRAAGIWGRPARRLAEELKDHYANKRNQLLAEGVDAAKADLLALQELGEAGTVAACAAENLQRGSWMARHPWLLAGAIFSAVVAVSAAVLYFSAMVLEGLFVQLGLDGKDLIPWMGPLEHLIAWSPFFVGLVLLHGLASRYPMGWKSLQLASLAVGLAGSLATCQITPPLHGPGSGALTLNGGSLIPLIFGEIANLRPEWRAAFLGHGNTAWSIFTYCLSPAYTIRLLLPLLLCHGLRWTFRQSAIEA